MSGRTVLVVEGAMVVVFCVGVVVTGFWVVVVLTGFWVVVVGKTVVVKLRCPEKMPRTLKHLQVWMQKCQQFEMI